MQTLQDLLLRRRMWLGAARDKVAAIGRVAATVLHFECSREGVAWAPGGGAAASAAAAAIGAVGAGRSSGHGSGSGGGDGIGTRLGVGASAGGEAAVRGAFDGCAALVTTSARALEAAAAAHRAEQDAGGVLARARAACSELRGAASSARSRAAAARAQLESGLPLLAVGAAELREFAAALGDAVRDHSALLCRDVGRLLQQLLSAVGKQAAARDIAAMASHLLSSRYAPVVAALELLAAELPPVLKGLDATDAELPPLPEQALMAVSEPQIVTEDPALAAAAGARGACLLRHLAEPVGKLVPQLGQLTGLGPALQRLLKELDALSGAASSVAAAIQSEHYEEDEAQSGAAGGGSGGGSGGGAAAGAAESGQGQDALGSAQASQSQGQSGEDKADGSGAAGREVGAGGWRWGTSAGPAAARHRRADEARRRAFAAGALRQCIAKLEGRDATLATPSSTSAAATTATTAPAAGGNVQPSNGIGNQGSAAGAQVGPAAAAGGGVTVPQQVELLIRQATSVDNLAQMFEGWMPWL